MIPFTSTVKWFFVGALLFGYCAPDPLDDLTINLNIKENNPKNIGQVGRSTTTDEQKTVDPTTKDGVFWTPGKDVNCFYDCGSKGGSCPEVCGENGWCCREDFTEDDCPDRAREVSTSGYHSCVKKSVSAQFYKMGYGEFCSGSSIRITSEKTCQTAASTLGLDWGGSWNGDGDFPGCIHSKDSRNKVYFNTSPNPSNDSHSVPKFANYAEICTYTELSCPTWFNTGDRRDEEVFENIETAWECSHMCGVKTNCNFWTWATKNAGSWARNCVLMSGYGYTYSDMHVVSGARTCDPIALPCPSYNTNTADRYFDEVYKNIGSALACADKCRRSHTCQVWTWASERAYQYALDCVLMRSFGYKVTDKYVISGERDCTPWNKRDYEEDITDITDAPEPDITDAPEPDITDAPEPEPEPENVADITDAPEHEPENGQEEEDYILPF